VLKNSTNDIVGSTDLQIVPTGKVNMRFIVNNLSWRGNDTEEIKYTSIRLENDGMKPITNISPVVSLPAEWEYTLIPERIELLNPNERIQLELKVKMNKNVLPGSYHIRFQMIGNHVNRNLQTQELELRAEVVKKTNVLIIIISVIFSLSAIIGAIWFIMKISRN
jgi:uncharacterized membrane protein